MIYIGERPKTMKQFKNNYFDIWEIISNKSEIQFFDKYWYKTANTI